MQKLAIQMLCYQLDKTWQFFTRTFKMQDHIYVEYVELAVFQAEYVGLLVKFRDHEENINDVLDNPNNMEDINTELDKLDDMMEVRSQKL